MKYTGGLKVFAPATIANLAVGYDILGLAINGPGDELTFKEGKKEGLVISSISGAKGKLPKDIFKNTAGFAAYKLLEASPFNNLSVEMEIHKKMPFGSGMGSSAASAVAGAYGMNAYLDDPFDENEVLKFAMMGEQLADGSYHADNVAPSLFGGICLIRDNDSLDVIKLPSPPGLYVVLIYPHVKILTRDSRGILNKDILLKDHIKQSGNLAAFISSLYKVDFDLMKRSLEDILIEPQRADLIPHFYDIKHLVSEHDVLGFSISGAGPSMFALCKNSFIADNVKDTIQKFYFNKKQEANIYVSKINTEGAISY